MATTTSIHIGSTLNKAEELNHNNFRDKRDNIDHTRSKDNIILVDKWNFSKTERENLKDFLQTEVCSNGKTIAENLEEWNDSRQRPRDRKTLDDLLNKQVVKKDKGQQMTQYALRQQGLIAQVGGEEAGQIDPELAKEILIDMFEKFCELTRGKVIITSAAIHMDEKTPHLHIDYLPISFEPEKKRGLPFEFSPHKIYEKFCDPEILNSVKSKDLRTRQNKIFSAVHDRFDGLLIETCNEWNIEIENPERTGVKHKNQNVYRMEEAVRKELEQKEKNLEQKTARWESMATRFFEEKKSELEQQVQEKTQELASREQRIVKNEIELVQAQNNFSEYVSDKEEELNRKGAVIQQQGQQINKHWETIAEKEKDLRAKEEDLNITRHNLGWSADFGDTFWEQFEGDSLVCPSGEIEEIIQATERTRQSLMYLLKNEPDLLNHLPEELADHCEQALSQEMEREQEQEPELEHSLGGLFD